MRGFYTKVFDYILDKRFELFQAMFYKLREEFRGEEDLLLKVWFEDYAKRKILEYFPLWDVLEYYPPYIVKKRRLIRSYINTYWRFCSRPYQYSAKIKEAMEFFQLEELNLYELKRRYRQLIKKYHPDVYPNKKEAHKQMLKINYNYQILLSYLDSVYAK